MRKTGKVSKSKMISQAEILLKMEKRTAADCVRRQCVSQVGAGTSSSPAQSEVLQPPIYLQVLYLGPFVCTINQRFSKALMDYLLSPVKDIDDGEAVEWCQWLMAGGQSLGLNVLVSFFSILVFVLNQLYVK